MVLTQSSKTAKAIGNGWMKLQASETCSLGDLVKQVYSGLQDLPEKAIDYMRREVSSDSDESTTTKEGSEN